MFKIEKNPHFTHEVVVMTPSDVTSDGKSYREDTFKARFKVHPASYVQTFDLRGAGQGVVDFLKATVTHLEDIIDEDGEPIPYTPALLDTVLENFACRLALLNTYMAAVAKAKTGN